MPTLVDGGGAKPPGGPASDPMFKLVSKVGRGWWFVVASWPIYFGAAVFGSFFVLDHWSGDPDIRMVPFVLVMLVGCSIAPALAFAAAASGHRSRRRGYAAQVDRRIESQRTWAAQGYVDHGSVDVLASRLDRVRSGAFAGERLLTSSKAWATLGALSAPPAMVGLVWLVGMTRHALGQGDSFAGALTSVCLVTLTLVGLCILGVAKGVRARAPARALIEQELRAAEQSSRESLVRSGAGQPIPAARAADGPTWTAAARGVARAGVANR